MSTERSAPDHDFVCRHCQEPVSTSQLMEVFAYRESGQESPRPVVLHYPKCAYAFERGIDSSQRFRWQRWYGRRKS